MNQPSRETTPPHGAALPTSADDVFVFPASFAQERLWFLDQLEPGSTAYHIYTNLRLRGRLDARALQESLNEIVRRHEALRTTFMEVEGRPVQIIGPPTPWPLSVIDLAALPEPEREVELRNVMASVTREPIDLARGPLMRATLVVLSEEERALLFTIHHIVTDGWSMGVFTRELMTLYDAFARGKPSPLPELQIQYADFSEWQREWLQGEVLERQLSYWRRQLDGLTPLQLPTDRPRPPVQTFRGASRVMELSQALSERLKALSQQEGVTLFMMMLAAFQALLTRYTGQEEIAVGTPIANRNREEIEPLIGFFVNSLVLRTDLSENPTFRELLGRVREVTLDAYAHQDLPFERLVEELEPERDMSRNPLVQATLVLHNAPQAEPRLSGLEVRRMEQIIQTTRFDLEVHLADQSQGLLVLFIYNADLFEGETIERMQRHFKMLLEQFVADPGQRVAAVEVLGEAERRQLLVEWNATRSDYPAGACIHELFEAQAGRSPDAVAVVFEDRRLTYRELNRQANQLAHHLKALGVGPETLVGFCVERSLEMVVGLLAILKAGGAYVPLDPEYPRERLAFMLEDTRAPVLVTQRRLGDRLPPHEGAVVYLDEAEGWATAPEGNPASGATADNLAYIIYTSGSTGKPKGVSVIHRGVVRLVKNTNYAALTPEEVFLQFAPISFDASTFEIWGALLNGAKLVVFPPHTPSLEELGQFVESQGVTTLWLTAALFHQMVEAHLPRLRGVRQLLAGGDVLSPPHVKKCLTELPTCRLINGYGPTENTTFTCCHPMTDPEQVGHSVSIGRPIANTHVYVLDAHRRPVPVGVAGELYIGGDGLARGYHNRPELTAEKFVPDPFSHLPGARLYRTGDLVRYRSDGAIEFLGRIDQQVKIRGFRVEPGEIETVLVQHPMVRESVVVAHSDNNGPKRLVAYVVPAGEGAPTLGELRAFLTSKLPHYMVPSAFVALEALPLSPNGKVDRRALPAPDGTRPELGARYVAPGTPLEQEIAEMWKAVLRVERVGIHDNFFDLGGHSLLATQVISRMRKSFQAELPLRLLFEAPTVAELALAITAMLMAQEDGAELARMIEEVRQLPADALRNALDDATHPNTTRAE